MKERVRIIPKGGYLIHFLILGHSKVDLEEYRVVNLQRMFLAFILLLTFCLPVRAWSVLPETSTEAEAGLRCHSFSQILTQSQEDAQEEEEEEEPECD